jgi:hypothetical protein
MHVNWRGLSKGVVRMKEVEVTEPAVLIRISQLYNERMSELALYEATRGVWKAGRKKRCSAKTRCSALRARGCWGHCSRGVRCWAVVSRRYNEIHDAKALRCGDQGKVGVHRHHCPGKPQSQVRGPVRSSLLCPWCCQSDQIRQCIACRSVWIILSIVAADVSESQ